ncbi:MAG: hypothetical protein Kow00129_15460 [Thermoleophilia bacterium]
MGAFRRTVLVGALAGMAGKEVMNRVTAALAEYQSEESRAEEARLAGGFEMPAARLLQQNAARVGLDLDAAQANRYGRWLDYGLAGGGGVAAALLVRGGVSPCTSGLVVGSAMWAAGDELLGAVGEEAAAPQEWPVVTHIRSLTGRLAYGLTLSLFTTLFWPLLRR